MKKTQLNILIIGAGGREHALAWKSAQSPQVQNVWVAPGNAGTALENKVQNVPLAVDDVEGLLTFAKQQQIDLTIVGPEQALAAGIVDLFQSAGLACFGPTRQVAQLETSKIFSKNFMRQAGIPTAQYAVFGDTGEALDYVRRQSFPLVIKADGLAAGKGVIIAENLAQAENAIISILNDKIFGSAGQRIVIEEFITGTEMSFIVMTDGYHVLSFPSSKDHKRRDDHDLGPNTGGMGAYSPAPQINAELEERILGGVIEPVIQTFAEQGNPYVGFLYAGLMITPQGDIKVLEFNCRLGDPETQPIMMRLQSDFIDLCLAAVHGRLNEISASWDARPALSVIIAAQGYPADYATGEPLLNLDKALSPSCKVFHGGTKQVDHKIVTHGGRVLAVTALGTDMQAARQQAYETVGKLAWPTCHYRKDIGESSHS